MSGLGGSGGGAGVVGAELVGGRLVLTSYGGQLLALDPRSGRSLD